MKAPKILRIASVMQKTGLARSTIYAGVRAGTFPKPIKLGDRASGWPEDIVDGWVFEKMGSNRPSDKNA
jgi:prophage regulatory protein